MPVYNGMPYLPAAVESILGQTFGEFDFIIADDGSDDGSREYLKGLRDPRIQLYLEERRGLKTTRNLLLQLTRTDACALMDADDIALPERLELQWDFMKRSPEVVLLGTQIKFMAGDRVFQRRSFPAQHSDILRALLRASPVICQPSCMLRTDAARSAGGYRLAFGEDIDLFLRMSEFGRVANLPAKLHMYRIHLGSAYATGYLDHKANIAYAITCYKRRLGGQPEPALADFLAVWRHCPPSQRRSRRLDAWSAREFRRALLALGANHRIRGFIHMSAAAFGRPRSAASELWSRIPGGSLREGAASSAERPQASLRRPAWP
jgi:glycosyltransferase involved in cell wall biosynthesis